jgi:AcrR family transcriptional regulator
VTEESVVAVDESAPEHAGESGSRATVDKAVPTPRKPRKRRRTQAERSAQSDQRMFAAAIELINERGTQKTTLKEIGERAGYSRGLAHSRFGSKDGFLRQLFVNFDGRWKAHLKTYLGDRHGIAAVLAAANALRDFLSTEHSYMRAMYVLWYESLGHESAMRDQLADHHRVYRQQARQWIEAGIADGEVDANVDAEQFAVQYCAFIFGVVYQWLVDASAIDLNAVFEDYQASVQQQLTRRD